MSARPGFGWAQPWLITTSGRPLSPVAGSATFASSGTPSNVLTRVATLPGQKRTLSCGAQSSVPNGRGGAAGAAPAELSRSARAASRTGIRGRMPATTPRGGGTCDRRRRSAERLDPRRPGGGPPGGGRRRRLGGGRRGGGRRRAHAQRENRDVVARRGARDAPSDRRVVDRPRHVLRRAVAHPGEQRHEV